MDFRELMTPPFRTEVLHSLPFEDYLNEPGLNPSRLASLDKSPKHFLHDLEHPQEPTAAMVLGAATHCMVFEPEKFPARYCVYDGVKNTRHKAYQEFLETEARGRTVLSPADAKTCDDIGDAVSLDPIAGPLVSGLDYEVSVFAELEGVQCKGRLDAVGRSIVVDLKTTHDIRGPQFGRTFVNLGYGFKIAMYVELMRQAGHTISTACIVAVESKPPYDVACYPIPEPVLDMGLARARRLIETFKHCEASGQWEGIAGGDWCDLVIPNWAMPDDDVLEVFSE